MENHPEYQVSPARNGKHCRKSECLEGLRYISVLNCFSALMKKASNGWTFASQRLFSHGEMITLYVNAPVAPLFQKAERLLNRIDVLLSEEKLPADFPYDRLQLLFLDLFNIVLEMETACGHCGIFVSILDRSDYLEQHLAHLEITPEQVREINCSMRRDLAILQAWQGHCRTILAELSSTGYAASEHATGAYMLDRLWQLCFTASPHFSHSYVGGFMQIPLQGKDPDLRSTFALLIKGASLCKSKAGASSLRRSIFAEADSRDTPAYPRMIAEYKEVVSPELPIIWDFVECLKHNCTPAICPVCGKAFVRARTQRVYCSRACGAPENRETLHKKRKTDPISRDVVLLESEQYLRAMRARLHYISKRDPSGKEKGSLSREEFDAWFTAYKRERDVYLNRKASAADQRAIKEAGDAFLNAIRPEGYTPHRRKRGTPAPPLEHPLRS